jgi:hypothetical protein
VAEEVDVAKIVRILHDAGYRGYVPLETLGAGDPRPKLQIFLARVREALEQLLFRYAFGRCGLLDKVELAEDNPSISGGRP